MRSQAWLSYTRTLLWAFIAVLLVIGIIVYPEQVFQASLQGLSIWWEIVFPTLLPFLILTEIMIALGLMHFIGYWLEPLMKRLLKLPGACAPALCLSFTAGYATGARTVAQLRNRKWISQEEGERLLAFSFISSPALIISVIAFGFFHHKHIGWMLLIIHLLTWILTLMLFQLNRHTKKISLHDTEKIKTQELPEHQSHIQRALHVMYTAKKEDGRSFGKLLSDAVSDAVQILFQIGGFIMLFAVITAIIHASDVLSTNNLDLMHTSIAGIFDMHLGSYQISHLHHLHAKLQTAMVSAMLAWGGCSIHAQVVSLVHRTRLSVVPYLQFRIIHALLAFALSFVLYQPIMLILGPTAPIFGVIAQPLQSHHRPDIWSILMEATLWGFAFLGFMLVISWMIRTFSNKTTM